MRTALFWINDEGHAVEATFLDEKREPIDYLTAIKAEDALMKLEAGDTIETQRI